MLNPVITFLTSKCLFYRWHLHVRNKEAFICLAASRKTKVYIIDFLEEEVESRIKNESPLRNLTISWIWCSSKSRFLVRFLRGSPLSFRLNLFPPDIGHYGLLSASKWITFQSLTLCDWKWSDSRWKREGEVVMSNVFRSGTTCLYYQALTREKTGRLIVKEKLFHSSWAICRTNRLTFRCQMLRRVMSSETSGPASPRLTVIITWQSSIGDDG